ncbi:MAG TPA: hypothetical protein VGY31_14640 [Terriglobia bacterium]|nr:hypothetical protein [Terriglobia bacterium]
MAIGYRYIIKSGKHEGKECRPMHASDLKPGWIVVLLKEGGTDEIPLHWLESKLARRKAKKIPAKQKG